MFIKYNIQLKWYIFFNNIDKIIYLLKLVYLNFLELQQIAQNFPSLHLRPNTDMEILLPETSF